MADSNGRTVMVQGRVVFAVGDLFQGRTKTVFGTQTPVTDAQGQPVKEYGFGLAVPKSVLSQTGPGQPGEIWAAIHEEAYSLFPSRQIPPTFAMKYKDGDGVDHNGVPYRQREGYEGCLVFACTTQIPIKFFKWENGQNILINEGIKVGDYVNVQLTVKAHTATGQGKSGLYLNPNAVQLIGYGTAIVNAPSGDQIFGTQAPPVPQGASATPIAPQAGMLVPPSAPPMPPAAPAYGAPPAAPQYGAPPAAPAYGAPPATPQPHYGVLPPTHQPPQQQAPAQPPMPPAAPAYGAPPAAPQYQPPQQPGVPGMPPVPQYPAR